MLQLDMQHGIKKLEIKGNFKAKANSLNCCYLLIIKLLLSRHLAISPSTELNRINEVATDEFMITIENTLVVIDRNQ